MRALVLLILFTAPAAAQAYAGADSRAALVPGRVPPASWQSQDPGDSLYRAARQALNRNDYWRSAELFAQIRSRYPRSAYTPDAFYWEAYAQYRRGGQESLRAALALLEEQERTHPSATTRRDGDARSLETRIRGELARRGDAESAVVVAEQAARAVAPPDPPRPPDAPRAPRAPTRSTSSSACRDADNDVQAAALNALLQMDSERALPILRRVLARRDKGSECLRRRAVFLVSQKHGPDAQAILLEAVRTDPDAEVRGQAVFWLSQVPGDATVAVLDSILIASRDPVIQDKALFAISQHESRAARQALRRYAERADISSELRGKAIFWIGQSNEPENAAFLRSMFGRVQDANLKDRLIFSISQQSGEDAGRWLLDVARSTSEPIEVRKKALFWAGQRGATTGADLATLYGTFADREMKDQLIFALSQKNDRAAVDKLLDIARRDPDRELRKKAIFWLSQSNDPRVAGFLAELLERP